jgi:hypothetical protein
MSGIDQRAKAAIAAASLVFAAGGFWALTQRDSAELVVRVAEVSTDLEDHERLESHPVTAAKLEVLVTEQRALRDDVARQAASLAAICQATGAQCR